MDAEAWNERYAGSDPVWSLTPNVFVERELAHMSPGTAVDLATGEGRNAIWLAKRGWRVTAVDFAQVGLDKGAAMADGLPITWVCADATRWVSPLPVGLVLVAYLQLDPEARRAAVSGAWNSLEIGGTLLWVAHDSTNLAEGTGGPQDPAVLMTAEDVLDDLDHLGATYGVVRAGRVERTVADNPGHGHGHEGTRTAWDCLVRVVRQR
ncbi:class I SAM-dependent methyltransferase [Nocardioides sp. KR10-350]|uniref:class I SAM-dependent methyltransferase n=1 Tax=Nocardioides cheoyonin TaxID=3156615 RepID=UPI0032B5D443